MDPFQREVIERLARIETKMEGTANHQDRLNSLELGAARRAALFGSIASLPALLTAIWAILRGHTA